MTLVLASASPRRKELLERVGFAVTVSPADIDESRLDNEIPALYAHRMASSKAEAIATGDAWVLAADTIVVVDNEILGKAHDDDEARAMLRQLSGRGHNVSTAYALRGPGGKKYNDLITTEVFFRDLKGDEIDDYVRSGEWRDKAGAYAIQGMAAAFVITVRGSFTNVIGLPLAKVISELARRCEIRPSYAAGIPS